MVEKFQNAKTHHQNIPAAPSCRCRIGDEGGRPNFSLWAEFWLITLCDGKYFIEEIIEYHEKTMVKR